jgi:hypothetical protein
VSDFIFTVSLGREMEFWNRVNNSDPTNAIFRVMVLAYAGLESDTVLRAKTTFTDLVSGTTNEVTNTDYARITLDDTAIAAYVTDQTAKTITASLSALLAWTAGGGPDAGDSWAKLVVGYDSDSTGGTDADIIPVTAHDLLFQGSVLVPNGSSISVDLTNGMMYARSSS